MGLELYKKFNTELIPKKLIRSSAILSIVSKRGSHSWSKMIIQMPHPRVSAGGDCSGHGDHH